MHFPLEKSQNLMLASSEHEANTFPSLKTMDFLTKAVCPFKILSNFSETIIFSLG